MEIHVIWKDYHTGELGQNTFSDRDHKKREQKATRAVNELKKENPNTKIRVFEGSELTVCPESYRLCREVE